MYADYFVPSELTITRSTDLEADLVNVKELYNTNKYDQALPLFQRVIENDPTASNLRLAYGNALMKCNRLNEARAQFDYILNANDPLYSDQSRWYLGLLDLKEGKTDSAISNFNILAGNPNADFSTEANLILEALEGLKQ